MDVVLTFGAPALLFAAVVAMLQRSRVVDRDFADFTVAGRSFGGFAQAMAFFNTFQPGTVFLGAFGFILTDGVVGTGLSTLLAPAVMFLMAEYFGIFTRIGDRASALASMIVGVACVCALQGLWPLGIPWAFGLTSGAVALVLNLAVYVVVALAVPRSEAEETRLDLLFGSSPAAAALFAAR